jgi:hypothetical protein
MYVTTINTISSVTQYHNNKWHTFINTNKSTNNTINNTINVRLYTQISRQELPLFKYEGNNNNNNTEQQYTNYTRGRTDITLPNNTTHTVEEH